MGPAPDKISRMIHISMVSQKDLVLVDFPFSDLQRSKVRPVIIISNNNYNSVFSDVIAVPVTSNPNARDFTICISNKDLANGYLPVDSKIKVDRVFSVDKSLIRRTVGQVNDNIHKQIVDILVGLIR